MLAVNHAVPMLRALVLDDDNDNRELLAEMLKFLGCEVEGCNDYNSSLECAQQLWPHLVLLDLAVPLIDGFATAQALLNQNLPPFFLAAVSGYGDKETVEHCLATGFHRHELKPLSMDRLIGLVQAARNFTGVDREIAIAN